MENNFCVYVLKDVNGLIRYVGEGRPTRVKELRNRSKKFTHFVENNECTLEILHENLTKIEAQKIENLLIQGLDNLLNRNSTGFVNELSYDFCNEYFYFDPTSPTLLRWNKTLYSGEYRNVMSTEKDKPAGHLSTRGYLRVCVNSKTYFVHRILWVLYNKKDIPLDKVVNHIDQNKTNNIESNLEICTHQQNTVRIDRTPAGKSNVVGVSVKIGKNRYTQLLCDCQILWQAL